MVLRNTLTTYGPVAKFLHWLIFFLVIIMLTFGFFLGDVPNGYKPVAYNTHKLIGLTILMLILLRGCWALLNVKPMLPIGTPAYQKLAERVVHFTLYVLLIAMPLAGWIGSVAANKPPVLGHWKIWLPMAENKLVNQVAFSFHYIIALTIILFVSIHVLAALYHHYIKKDDILRRMLPHRH